jgi:hydrogenase expression/formation protein HypC
MCLGIPAKLIEVHGDDPLTRTGKASCGGVVREIYLAGCPEAQVGDYVVVHAGFAISRLDVDEANRVFDYLRDIAATSEPGP